MLRCRSLSLAILASSFAASSFRRTFLIVSPQSPQTNQGIVNLIQGARENSRRGREFGKKKKSFDVFEVSEVEKKWLCPLAPFTFSLSLSPSLFTSIAKKEKEKTQAREEKPTSHGAPPQCQVGPAQGQAIPDHRHPGTTKRKEVWRCERRRRRRTTNGQLDHGMILFLLCRFFACFGALSFSILLRSE